MTQQKSAARSFRDLQVWRKAHALVLSTYRYTAGLPKHEMFGLTSQLRRAAVSIPANIAEGFCRRGRADKARFLNFAESSLEECRYYFILAYDLGYGETDVLTQQADEVSRILNAYVNAILNDNR